MAFNWMRSSSLLVKTIKCTNVQVAFLSVNVTVPTRGQPPVGPRTPLTLLINKNLKLNSTYTLEHLKAPPGAEVLVPSNNKLVILFAYMMAQEKHLAKYRLLYYDKGFDVLTVKTPPLDFLYPTIGTQRIATNLLDTLNKKLIRSYPSIVIHGLSVGGYQYSEVLLQLHKGADAEAAANLPPSERKCTNLIKSIKGTIYDSICDVETVPYGLSRTVFGDNIIASMVEKAVHMHNRIFYSISRKHHEAAQSLFEQRPVPCPSLFLASEDDKMADFNVIKRIVGTSQKLGNDAKLKSWEKSLHVAHYYNYPQEYIEEINQFLKKINL